MLYSIVNVILLFSVLFYLYAVLSRRVGYAGMLVSVYSFWFLFLPGTFHAKDNRFPFYNIGYSEYYIIKGLVVGFVFYLMFFVGYCFFKRGVDLCGRGSLTLGRHNNKTISFIVFSFLFQVFYIAQNGLSQFLLMRSELSIIDDGGSLLMFDFARSLSFVTVFFSLFLSFYNRSFLKYLTSFISIILFLIIDFPLALPRYQIFGFIIVLYIHSNGLSYLYKASLGIFFGVGVFTVFPLMSYLTRNKGGVDDMTVLESYKSSGDFDGLQSIINVVKYTDTIGYSWGKQMLSNLFAFVPRSIWEGKKQPTGVYTAEFARYDFNNISAPLASEFYSDFGLWGAVFGGVLFGVFCKAVDAGFKKSICINKLSYMYGCALVFSSMAIILSRGSLMGVINAFYITLFLFSLFKFLLSNTKLRFL